MNGVSTVSMIGAGKGGLIALVLAFAFLLAPPSASANPEVRLEWIEKGGAEIDPPSSTVVVTDADIQAEVELVLRISLVLDEVALHEFGFGIIFDDDDRDELDFAVNPGTPTAYGPFEPIGYFSFLDSDDGEGGYGDIGPYRGCVVNSICDVSNTEDGTPVGNQTIIIDEVSFAPTANASNDPGDVVVARISINEEFRDANGDVIPHSEIDFRFASIIPEPGAPHLVATALLTLTVLARRRGRSVLQ